MVNPVYSVYVDGARLGWSFRSLWAARYNAVTAAGAARAASALVVDDSTGEVMYQFSRSLGILLQVYAAPDADAIAYPPEKCFYNVSPAPAVGA